LVHLLKSGAVKPYDTSLDEMQFPLFVTWQKNGALRGCIGTFASDSLGKTLQRYSLIAALQDRRFPPINESELEHLRCEISLLSDFEKIEDPLDWHVGTHGIEVEFNGPEDDANSSDKEFRGTFLPSVAPDQNWNQVETLEHLTRKAGYNGGFEKQSASIHIDNVGQVPI
jgi:AMME syndrome candidate gene 1 protein